MRPNKLKIQASFFSSPYRSSRTSSQLSPIPSETPKSSNSSESCNDPTTPLLPPTPSMAEKGREGFPFPHEQRGLGRRMRSAWSGGSKGPVGKRILWIVCMVVLLLLIGRQTGHVSLQPFQLSKSLIVDDKWTFPTSCCLTDKCTIYRIKMEITARLPNSTKST